MEHTWSQLMLIHELGMYDGAKELNCNIGNVSHMNLYTVVFFKLEIRDHFDVYGIWLTSDSLFPVKQLYTCVPRIEQVI